MHGLGGRFFYVIIHTSTRPPFISVPNYADNDEFILKKARYLA